MRAVNCDYNPPIVGFRDCNDYGDWGDLLKSVGGSYDMSDIENRASFFPKDVNDAGLQ